MRKEDRYVENVHLLKEDYKDVFKKIEIYIQAHSLVVESTSSLLEEVLNMLLDAQEDNKEINEVIGEDIEEFCKELIDSNKRTLLDNVLDWLGWYRYIALFFGVMEMISLLVDISDNIVNPLMINVDMGIFVVCMIVSFALAYLLSFFRKKMIFKYQWYSPKADNVVSIMILICMFFICFTVPDYMDSLIKIPRIIFIPFTLIFFFIMNKKKKEEKNTQRELGNLFEFKDTLYNEIIKTYREQYNKYKIKCIKKNIEVLEVKKWYKNKYKKEEKEEIINHLLFVVIIALAIIFTGMDSTLIDTIIFAVLLILIEIGIYKVFHKSYEIRKDIYQEVELRNTDIFDDGLLKEF